MPLAAGNGELTTHYRVLTGFNEDRCGPGMNWHQYTSYKFVPERLFSMKEPRAGTPVVPAGEEGTGAGGQVASAGIEGAMTAAAAQE